MMETLVLFKMFKYLVLFILSYNLPKYLTLQKLFNIVSRLKCGMGRVSHSSLINRCQTLSPPVIF